MGFLFTIPHFSPPCEKCNRRNFSCQGQSLALPRNRLAEGYEFFLIRQPPRRNFTASLGQVTAATNPVFLKRIPLLFRFFKGTGFFWRL
ncbi:MAG: hypothetical protein A3B80_08470 [Elusimicrobia bacterium RIFCSPHIGHO2_02_FULL_39_36]|nr:MAG: hypothetical protein A2034_05795 [Elusimicrobia bacterium GWA2_38_7]OGR79254.1 MAG: hypothetical protein A3B80_08470 [Elusimicrobia bacterium RIFCSPHIGHO2_02_FULL_39_36]